ncbi:MAG: protein kinase [Verrucomicrobiales bacterium]|nr:protein kinase [Verrucomicrobiales bacterium]
MSDLNPDFEEVLFSTALPLAPRERSAYLDAACSGQPSLRHRVEKLLAAKSDLDRFMETPASPEALATLGGDYSYEPGDDTAGRRIGRYHLLQRIGEGGCGVVYLAEQVEPVRRQVALKVIKSGMDTRSVVARFEAERQALALMDHPNIAKVLDGGATPNGHPFFVMELVRGCRITEYCDLHRLSTRDRIPLFIQVCKAVQHAHQKGIIHRDLKPSNILVTAPEHGAPGVPMIIDFGIAKATQGRLTDHTLLTEVNLLLGTPAYMSPEQATITALDIDTRSDIYSLGVLLYELLTGHTPFDTRELLAAGFEELRRTIREREPPRPSLRLKTLGTSEQEVVARLRRTDPPKLVQQIHGDLDWILMKCLEKDRARRYETANALAADLQRHLDHEPVLARPPSRIYQLQKTLFRHKVGVAAAAAVAISVAAGLVISSLAAVRARHAELQTRRTGYVADMDLANRALQDGDLGVAQLLLRRHQPRRGETDLRNWEWRYLAGLGNGDPHESLAAHTSAVLFCQFLDRHTLLTAGSADWRTVVWNLASPHSNHTITNRGYGGGVSGVAVAASSPNHLYYRAKWRSSTSLWKVDLRSGTESPLLETESPIGSVDLSPNQGVLAVASGSQVGLWDLNGNRWIQHHDTEAGEATQGSFSPDGRVLAVADLSGHIALWNLAEGTRRILTRDPGYAGILSFSPDGRWLVAPGGPGATRVWNVGDLSLAAELPDTATAELAAFSTDGRYLVIVGGGPSIRVWETAGWKKVRTLLGHTDPITALDFSPDGRLLATGSRNGEVKLWSTENLGSPPGIVPFPPSIAIGLAADGSGFWRIPQPIRSNGVALSWTASVWSGNPPRAVFDVPLPAGEPPSCALLPDGRALVLGGEDGSLRIAGPGRELVITNAHDGSVYLMDVSMDGTTLATKGLHEDRVLIWRLPGLTPIAELSNAQHIHAIKLSDDGGLLAGMSGPGDLGVWEIPSMKGPKMWHGLPAAQAVTACAISPDHRRLAAALNEGGAFLFDLTTHQRTVLPRALTQYDSLSFSADGSRLAAGADGESRLLDTTTGQTVLQFTQRGLRLAFTRDSEELLAVHPGGTWRLRVPPLNDLKAGWLRENPSQEPPPYLGPMTNYTRPGGY